MIFVEIVAAVEIINRYYDVHIFRLAANIRHYGIGRANHTSNAATSLFVTGTDRKERKPTTHDKPKYAEVAKAKEDEQASCQLRYDVYVTIAYEW